VYVIPISAPAPLCIIALIIYGQEQCLWNTFMCNFLHSFLTSSLFGRNNLLRILCEFYIGLLFFSQNERLSFAPNEMWKMQKDVSVAVHKWGKQNKINWVSPAGIGIIYKPHCCIAHTFNIKRSVYWRTNLSRVLMGKVGIHSRGNRGFLDLRKTKRGNTENCKRITRCIVFVVMIRRMRFAWVCSVSR
jgi:hypothetical protein